MLRCEKVAGSLSGLIFTQPRLSSTSTARYSFDGWFGTDTTVPAAGVPRVVSFPPYSPIGGVGTCTMPTLSIPSRSLIAFR